MESGVKDHHPETLTFREDLRGSEALDDGAGRAGNSTVDARCEVNEIAGTGLLRGTEGSMKTLTGFDPRGSHAPLRTRCHLSPHRNVEVDVRRTAMVLG